MIGPNITKNNGIVHPSLNRLKEEEEIDLVQLFENTADFQVDVGLLR